MTEQEIIERLKKPRDFYFNGREKEFQELVLRQLDYILSNLNLPKKKEIKLQCRLKGVAHDVYPDIVVLHEDDTLSIFEIKCTSLTSNSRARQVAAIGQLLHYQILAESHANGRVRPFIVDWIIQPETYLVCKANGLRIALLELNKEKLFIPYSGI